MPRIWIGIDPGEHTGVAVWDADQRAFRLLATLPLHKALHLVKEWRNDITTLTGGMSIVFEDARQRTWFPRERNASEYRGRLMGAGAAKRDARIWEEFLSDEGIPFEAHKPSAGGTKWSADYFARITGYKSRCSEHARDAALLVFGRK